MQKIKDDYAEAGDLGNVAAAARAKQKTMFKPKPLTVQGVFKCASLQGLQSTYHLLFVPILACKQRPRQLLSSRVGFCCMQGVSDDCENAGRKEPGQEDRFDQQAARIVV